MDNHVERVRRRAYQIWLDEGRPEGREAVHWGMASELVAIEDRQNTELVGRNAGNKETVATGAERPTKTDAGEQAEPPPRAAKRSTVFAPPTTAGATKAMRSAAAAATGDEIKSLPAKKPSAKTTPTKRGKM